MRRYAVETRPQRAPGKKYATGYLEATVTRYGDVVGRGSGATEPRAIDAAWRDYWRQTGRRAAP